MNPEIEKAIDEFEQAAQNFERSYDDDCTIQDHERRRSEKWLARLALIELIKKEVKDDSL